MKECDSDNCAAHQFVLQLIDEIKEDKRKMEDQHKSLTENVIKITENLLELQRSGIRTDGILQELKLYNSSQDTKIEKTSIFIWKAAGVIAAITFVATVFPLAIWLIKSILTQPVV